MEHPVVLLSFVIVVACVVTKCDWSNLTRFVRLLFHIVDCMFYVRLTIEIVNAYECTTGHDPILLSSVCLETLATLLHTARLALAYSRCLRVLTVYGIPDITVSDDTRAYMGAIVQAVKPLLSLVGNIPTTNGLYKPMSKVSDNTQQARQTTSY